MIEFEDEADGADVFATGLESDGENGFLAFLEALLMGTDPLLGHAILVGMRDAQRRRGNVAVAREEFHPGRVAQREWTGNEPLGLKRWALPCGRSLQGAPPLRG